MTNDHTVFYWRGFEMITFDQEGLTFLNRINEAAKVGTFKGYYDKEIFDAVTSLLKEKECPECHSDDIGFLRNPEAVFSCSEHLFCKECGEEW